MQLLVDYLEPAIDSASQAAKPGPNLHDQRYCRVPTLIARNYEAGGHL